mmetsp:Transcript_8116/g.23896  ORF Transcript_8116/g.23896 Transcript_8116/m.23896 type:complete len:238 (-) Transcript_8116:265-978(-)
MVLLVRASAAESPDRGRGGDCFGAHPLKCVFPRADRDDDEMSFYSAHGGDMTYVSEVPETFEGIAGPEAEDAADTHVKDDDTWKQAFLGGWRLEHHREDYDHWLALKRLGPIKRKFAAALPATKHFVAGDGSLAQLTHVYTLAGTLELTQHWDMRDNGVWKDEEEAGHKCTIHSHWGDKCLVIQKRFPGLGLTEVVENRIAAGGARLVSTMRTTVVSTNEMRMTSDSFVRIPSHGKS